MTIEINNQVKAKINQDFIKKIIRESLKALKLNKNFELSIALVDQRTIRKLNKDYRGIDRVTDVLSFPEEKEFLNIKKLLPIYLGEILICYPQALKQAREQKDNISCELKILLIHSLLHLLGYDHNNKKNSLVMSKKERAILNHLDKN